MLQVVQMEFLRCKKCHHNYSEQNYPMSLSCNQSLCKNCTQDMLDNNKPCPFDNSDNPHSHTIQNTAKNITLINIMDVILKLIKLNKKDKKYDLELIKFINELKNKNKKNILEKEDYNCVGTEVLKNNKHLGNGKIIHKAIGI